MNKTSMPSNVKKSSISGPEWVAIFFVAIFLDALGVIAGILILLFGIGIALSYIPDILGIATIGLWAWFRMGKMPITKKLRRYVTRFGLTSLVELTPIAGIFFTWTLFVIIKFVRR